MSSLTQVYIVLLKLNSTQSTIKTVYALLEKKACSMFTTWSTTSMDQELMSWQGVCNSGATET